MGRKERDARKRDAARSFMQRTKLQRHCSAGGYRGFRSTRRVLRGIIAAGQGCWSRLALIRRGTRRARAETGPASERASDHGRRGESDLSLIFRASRGQRRGQRRDEIVRR